MIALLTGVTPMFSHNDDESVCPRCQQPFEKAVRIKRGQRFNDVSGGNYWDYVNQYDRRCTTMEHVEDRNATVDERILYFHQTPQVRL